MRTELGHDMVDCMVLPLAIKHRPGQMTSHSLRQCRCCCLGTSTLIIGSFFRWASASPTLLGNKNACSIEGVCVLGCRPLLCFCQRSSRETTALHHMDHDSLIMRLSWSFEDLDPQQWCKNLGVLVIVLKVLTQSCGGGDVAQWRQPLDKNRAT
eukprot:1173420-Amphidinium_carterae.1